MQRAAPFVICVICGSNLFGTCAQNDAHLMAFLSAIFYFLGYHPFLAMLALLVGDLFGSAVLAQLGGHRAWFALLIPIFVFTQINFFTGHMLNALFLNAFGTQGHAVIVHSRETDSQLNDKNIWEYDAVLKTADGHDVPLQFNTMSAAIYPIRNAILIPPENDDVRGEVYPGVRTQHCHYER